MGRFVAAVILASWFGTGIAWGAPPPVDFNREVKPILASKCFACHGPDSAARKAELRLDTFEGAIAKTESGGLAIVPNHPEKGDLLDRVTNTDADLRMPPKETGKQVTAARQQTQTYRRSEKDPRTVDRRRGGV